jgi:hypothetical protein
VLVPVRIHVEVGGVTTRMELQVALVDAAPLVDVGVDTSHGRLILEALALFFVPSSLGTLSVRGSWTTGVGKNSGWCSPHWLHSLGGNPASCLARQKAR